MSDFNTIEDIFEWCSAHFNIYDKNRISDSLTFFTKTILKKVVHILYEESNFKKIYVRRHSLGFFSLSFPFNSKNRMKKSSIRINIYSKLHFQYKVPEIHNHAFNFTSKIVIGELQNTIFKEQDGLGFRKLKFDGKMRSFEKLVDLEEYKITDLLEGDIYSMPAAAIHSITPKTDLAVTTLVRSPHIREFSNQYCQKNAIDNSTAKVEFKTFLEAVKSCKLV